MHSTSPTNPAGLTTSRRPGVRPTAAVVLMCLAFGLCGCEMMGRLSRWPHRHAYNDPHIQAATSIEYPAVQVPVDMSSLSTARPLTIDEGSLTNPRDITLEEAVRHALSSSKIIRDVGGLVLRSPQNARSTMDPALQETDPRFGVEAALSEFDAQFTTRLFYENNNRALNNQFFGGGTRILRQRAAVLQTEIAKQTAYGGEVFLRNNANYDENNAPANLFPSAWDVNYEAGFRQSLLRGAGVDVNRITGASDVPGVYNGVLIARTNTDISIADFQLAVRDFVSDVENAYWDLFFAYRDLDAKINARNAALETWRNIRARQDLPGAEAAQEAQAREQYYRFEEEVQDALTGRLTDPTRTHNGSPGGTFRRASGVQVAERRLRYIIGLPINDGQLLRPVDDPIVVPVTFDWELSLTEALAHRAELRRQKWLIEQRRLQLIGARNFLKPDLDLVGLYRWRGLGQSLIDPEGGGPRFDDAYTNLVSGDFQEWQMGVELSFPVGNRRAQAGVRNAEYLLSRELALLKEQEYRVTREVSEAFAEVERAYQVMQTVYNRRQAARDQQDALQTAYEFDEAPLNLLLDAQRRAALAESRYYEALVDYNIAIKNLQYAKGTLLDYSGVQLAEGPWSHAAHEDARDRVTRRVPVEQERLTPDHRVIVGGRSSVP